MLTGKNLLVIILDSATARTNAARAVLCIWQGVRLVTTRNVPSNERKRSFFLRNCVQFCFITLKSFNYTSSVAVHTSYT